MAFHSLLFIFAFLPPALLLHWLAPHRLKNTFLLVLSLFFYAWGDAAALPVLLFSITINYAAGLIIEKAGSRKIQKLLLTVAVAANLGLLTYSKYLGFFVRTIADLHLLPAAGGAPAQHVPLGISFFTFSAVAYLIDIYRRKTSAEKNIITFGAYLAMFQKITAGPMARYADLACSLAARAVTLEGFANGAQRLIFGLGKKVFIANTLGIVADEAFRMQGADLDMPTAWLGIVCYTLQIYFDFSGYTDMAVGLGRMFGLRLPENFNDPYTAQSIRDFWQRWHITLSSWFRDYLYIPLGGNRCSPARTYTNLVIVFLLCGLWHGASWNFAAWGLYHGLFLVFERIGLARLLAQTWRPLRHGYAVLAIMTGWVFFRAETLAHALSYLRSMVSFSAEGFDYFRMTFISNRLIFALLAACLLSTPVGTLAVCIKNYCDSRIGTSSALARASFAITALIALTGIFIASAMLLAGTTWSPFIYRQF
jgi:alginate O-acetyltransferase complex protein AlgI